MVTEGMAGPLARSPLAIGRAVVAWCRAANGEHPGPLADAVAAGLRAGVVGGEANAALDLPAAPAGTLSLRHRIAGLRDWTTEA
ncbi:hypothetical protein D3C83_112940 [compost metagenome]